MKMMGASLIPGTYEFSRYLSRLLVMSAHAPTDELAFCQCPTMMEYEQ